jgi:hypothetical protein
MLIQQSMNSRQVTYDCFFHPLIFCTSRFALLLNHICLLNELHSLILLPTKFAFDQFSVVWSLGNVTQYHSSSHSLEVDMTAYKELVTVSWLCITLLNFYIVCPNMHVW